MDNAEVPKGKSFLASAKHKHQSLFREYLGLQREFADLQEYPVAQIKLFTPDSSWTWYVIEFDPDERLCFGLVIGHEHEMGYFSIAELEDVRGPMRLRIERDLYFQPTPISECR